MHAGIGEKLAFMTCNICDGPQDNDCRDSKLKGKRRKNELKLCDADFDDPAVAKR
jgi:hypothetical protein